jgi:hypothetical protein
MMYLIPAASIDVLSAAILMRASVSGTRFMQTTVFMPRVSPITKTGGKIPAGLMGVKQRTG